MFVYVEIISFETPQQTRIFNSVMSIFSHLYKLPNIKICYQIVHSHVMYNLKSLQKLTDS